MLALAAGAVAVVLVQRRPPPQRLLVGLDDDTVKWIAEPDGPLADYRRLGVRAVRIWIPWHGGGSPRGLDAAYLDRAEALARRGERVVLAVFGLARDAPLTAAARARYCRFARLALARAPSVHDLVAWNEANSPTYWPAGAGAPAYERLLARCWDVLHAGTADADLLDSTASHHDPAAFLAGLGAAYRASGRSRPLVDTFGHNPYPDDSLEPPDARHDDGTIGIGDYPRLLASLEAAFAGTAQPAPGEGGVRIWYLEDGYQTRVPAGKRRHYSGRETERSLAGLAASASASLQARLVGEALEVASCQPAVGALFNFELTDEDRLSGWQSGLLWRDGRRKPAFAAYAAAAARIAAGAVGCDSVRAARATGESPQPRP